MTTTLSFHEQCEAAYRAAYANAAPFTPSMAKMEAAFQPVVDVLRGMPYEDAKRFVQASYGGAGSWDSLAVRMFKEQMAPLGHDPCV